MLTQAMAQLRPIIRKAIKNERGATAVEYGIMVSLIAAVIIVTVSQIGTKIETAFTTVLTNLK